MVLDIGDATISIWLLIALGLIVGTLSGFFGVGGAFLMTPALNLLGFPMIEAIATDLALMVGSAVVGTRRHLKLGHVDVKLGLALLLGTAVGVWLGKETVVALAAAGRIDPVLRGIYMLLLFGLAGLMLRDYYLFARRARGRSGRPTPDIPMSRLAQRLHRLRWSPRVTFRASRLTRISLWLPIGVGFFTGFLAALLGVGGGFIRMPALIYGLGVPTTVAVGTDLFEIVFSSAIGTFLYALDGHVHLLAAMTLLLGAVIGVEIGSHATVYVVGARLRHLFALTVLGGGISIALRQVADTAGLPWLATVAMWLIIGVGAAMASVIVVALLHARYRAGLIRT